MKRKAIVLGANHGELDRAKTDAQRVAQALENNGYEVNDLSSRGELTRELFSLEVVRFASGMKSNDILMFYFAGHGFTTDSQSYYLAFEGSDLSQTETCMEGAILVSVLKDIPAQIVLVIDACKSMMIKPYLATFAYQWKLLCAGKHYEEVEEVLDNEEEIEGGVMTHYFCQALNGPSDVPHARPFLTLDEIGQFINERIQPLQFKGVDAKLCQVDGLQNRQIRIVDLPANKATVSELEALQTTYQTDPLAETGILRSEHWQKLRKPGFEAPRSAFNDGVEKLKRMWNSWEAATSNDLQTVIYEKIQQQTTKLVSLASEIDRETEKIQLAKFTPPFRSYLSEFDFNEQNDLLVDLIEEGPSTNAMVLHSECIYREDEVRDFFLEKVWRCIADHKGYRAEDREKMVSIYNKLTVSVLEMIKDFLGALRDKLDPWHRSSTFGNDPINSYLDFGEKHLPLLLSNGPRIFKVFMHPAYTNSAIPLQFIRQFWIPLCDRLRIRSELHPLVLVIIDDAGLMDEVITCDVEESHATGKPLLLPSVKRVDRTTVENWFRSGTGGAGFIKRFRKTDEKVRRLREILRREPESVLPESGKIEDCLKLICNKLNLNYNDIMQAS